MKAPRWFRRLAEGFDDLTLQPRTPHGLPVGWVVAAPPQSVCLECGAGYVGTHPGGPFGWFRWHRRVCRGGGLEDRLGAAGAETLWQERRRGAEGEVPPPSEDEIAAFIAERRAAGGHLPDALTEQDGPRQPPADQSWLEMDGGDDA